MILDFEFVYSLYVAVTDPKLMMIVAHHKGALSKATLMVIFETMVSVHRLWLRLH